MMPLALAFYITISAEPIEPGPNKYDSGTRVVLVGVPSRKLAQEWAMDLAKRTVLAEQHQQKLKEIRFLPLSNNLLTLTGRSNIDWSKLSKQVQDIANDRRHESDVSFGGGLFMPSPNAATTHEKDWDSLKRLRAKAPKEFRDTMNWDESHPAYFVCHDREKAIIVEAVNFLAASIPIIKYTGDDKPVGAHVYVDCISWIEEYKK